MYDRPSLNGNIAETAVITKFSDATLVNCQAQANIGVKYAKHAGFVVVQIYVNSLTAKANTLITTLPDGYRPLMAVGYVGKGGLTYDAKAFFSISDSGAIYVYSDDTYAQGYIVFWAK